MQKAEIDYFAPFVSLWLACNAWYVDHYSEIKGNDREFINTLKTDFTARNKLFHNFKKILEGDQTKQDIAFKANLEMLHHALNRKSIQPDKFKQPLSLNAALVDFSMRDDDAGYINLIGAPSITLKGEVAAKDQGLFVQLDTVYVVSDLGTVFAGLFEIIYQIRNLMIHGSLLPEKDEHEIVKYTYMVLHEIMPK